MRAYSILFLAILALPLWGCGNDKDANKPAAARTTDPATIARGHEVFTANCASCHGRNGEGAPNWHQQGPDGKWPAPPLNGTGHAWHHPYPVLVRTIRQGTKALGGNMPAWDGRLSETEIQAVIAWFQSRWPDEIYAAWAEMDRQAGNR